jgi:hypothetical protein
MPAVPAPLFVNRNGKKGIGRLRLAQANLVVQIGHRIGTLKRGCAGQYRPLVGASLLAMDVNDNACLLDKHVAFRSIASKLAPTK